MRSESYIASTVVMVFSAGNVVQAVLKGGQVDGEKSSQRMDWFQVEVIRV